MDKPSTTGSSTTKTAPKSTNPFVFSDAHTAYWGSNYTMDTPIARAWARTYERGLRVGSPTGDVVVFDNLQTQLFNFCQASFDPDNDRNPNQMVIFQDGRGVITQESGL